MNLRQIQYFNLSHSDGFINPFELIFLASFLLYLDAHKTPSISNIGIKKNIPTPKVPKNKITAIAKAIIPRRKLWQYIYPTPGRKKFKSAAIKPLFFFDSYAKSLSMSDILMLFLKLMIISQTLLYTVLQFKTCEKILDSKEI